MPDLICQHCKASYHVIPFRVALSRFCSVRCRADWRSTNWTGDAHPRWAGGEREKVCSLCKASFVKGPTEAISTFTKRKFCCKDCADRGGFRYSGKDHPNYREDARRKNRGGAHHQWSNAVISRDNATCQECGAQNVELHAHHMKRFVDNPELRWDLANGLTLCAECHWNIHSREENRVNSGNPLTVGAEGNPDPSLGRKTSEGATTRGRASRRVEAKCAECGAFISRSRSDMAGRDNHFCTKTCSSRFNKRAGKIGRKPRQ